MHFLSKDVTSRTEETTIIAAITTRRHDLQESVIQTSTHSTITIRSIEGMKNPIIYLYRVDLTIK